MSNGAGSVLHLGLLGGVTAQIDGRPIALPSAPVRRILGYLALSENLTETRHRLAAAIWENSDDSRARQNLRQALHKLGLTIGKDWDGVHADRRIVQLRSDRVVTDLGQALTQLDRGEVVDRLTDGSLQPGHLLADETGGGPLFESWLVIRQRALEARIRDRLSEMMHAGAPDQAERAALALIKLDASDEKAARFLIRHYHKTGQMGAALSVYDALWQHLSDEYDSEPSGDTQALIAAVKLDEPMAQVTAVSVSEPRHVRIGLAAGAMPGDSFVGGMMRLFRADLMATLLRFRMFEIVDLEMREAQVDYTLTLSAGASGSQLLLSVVLVRARDGVAIWSDRWTGLAENWLTTQMDVFARVASSLSIHVSQSRLHDMGRTDNAARVIDDWLLGNWHLDQFRESSLRQAETLFQRVISNAPEAAFGYASLARLRNGKHLMLPGYVSTPQEKADAKRLAQKAVALDPIDSRSHLAHGWAQCLLREFGPASVSFELARSGNPNDPWCVLSTALGAAYCGDQPLADTLAARVLDEGWTTEGFQWGFHAPLRFLSGDYTGCVDAAERAGTAILNSPAWRAAALWHLERYDEAAAAWTQFEDLSRQHWSVQSPATTDTILAWVQSLFPFRDAAHSQRFNDGTSGSARYVSAKS